MPVDFLQCPVPKSISSGPNSHHTQSYRLVPLAVNVVHEDKVPLILVNVISHNETIHDLQTSSGVSTEPRLGRDA